MRGWKSVLAILGLGVAACRNAGRAGDAAAVHLGPGDTAPPFELPGSDGKTWRLAEFAGKKAVVVAWFPKAFTGG